MAVPSRELDNRERGMALENRDAAGELRALRERIAKAKGMAGNTNRDWIQGWEACIRVIEGEG